MMTAADFEVARRIVACLRFRQMGGMRWLHRGGHASGHLYAQREQVINTDRWDLDISDPATIGCLERLVETAYDGNVLIEHSATRWNVAAGTTSWCHYNTSSYGAALASALEAKGEE